MYSIKINKIGEMLDGRSVTYVANKVGITRIYLSYILNGKRTISKSLAYFIVKSCNKDAEIEDFFERVK